MALRARMLSNVRSRFLRQVRLSTTEVKQIEAAVKQVMEDNVKPLDHWKDYSNVLLKKPSKPMVLLLGNHSAGKSTFINTLLGEKLQATGVAPTDDGFTLIMRGDCDAFEDGPTVVGTPSHGLEELATFGSSFVNLLKMKTCKLPDSSHCPKDLIIVDSPGMIGTPGDAGNSIDRDYDLLKVTRWFAERADVILLMFDPANPGTTGETLDVLTHSLVNLEHKFLIVMNKVDQFDNVSDFARAYGALCWNLSKVVRRKDIPRIYTIFTPGMQNSRAEEEKLPIAEFEQMRNQVMQEVLRAPTRQMDNLLTQLDKTSQHVFVSAKVAEVLRKKYSSMRFRLSTAVAMLTLGGLGSVGLLAQAGALGLQAAFGGACLAGLGGASSMYASRQFLEKYHEDLLETIDATIAEVLPELSDRELTQFSSLKHTLRAHLSKAKLSSLPRASNRQFRTIQEIRQKKIPELREKARKARYSASSA